MLPQCRLVRALFTLALQIDLRVTAAAGLEDGSVTVDHSERQTSAGPLGDALPPLPRAPKPPPLPPKPKRAKPPLPPKPPEYDETVAAAMGSNAQAERDEADRLAMLLHRVDEEHGELSIAEYENELRERAAAVEEQARYEQALEQATKLAAQDELDALLIRSEEDRAEAESEAVERNSMRLRAAEKQRAIDDEEAYFKRYGDPHEL